MKQNPPDLAEFKNYIEVSNKGGRPNTNLKSFLDNDRKVLSFQILWEDFSYDGGDKYYILNYYLSDEKVEVKEINTVNSGRNNFPLLLKKQKLSKKPMLTHCPGMNMRNEDYYKPEDFNCGDRITIYGRDCLIYDCDAFTRQWYQVNCNRDQKAVSLRTPPPAL